MHKKSHRPSAPAPRTSVPRRIGRGFWSACVFLGLIVLAGGVSGADPHAVGQWQTLTVVMFQALEGSGAGRAAATASMLIFFTVVPVALVYRLLRRYEMSLL